MMHIEQYYYQMADKSPECDQTDLTSLRRESGSQLISQQKQQPKRQSPNESANGAQTEITQIIKNYTVPNHPSIVFEASRNQLPSSRTDSHNNQNPSLDSTSNINLESTPANSQFETQHTTEPQKMDAIYIAKNQEGQLIFARERSEQINQEENKGLNCIVKDQTEQSTKIQTQPKQKGSPHLAVVNCVSVTIAQPPKDSVERSALPQLEGTTAAFVDGEQKKQLQKQPEKKKVEPLDMTTLSVLNLSSRGIKQIRPSSPKGEKTLKLWQKLSKPKAKEQKVSIDSTILVQSTSSAPISQSPITNPNNLKEQIPQPKSFEQKGLVQKNKSSPIVGQANPDKYQQDYVLNEDVATTPTIAKHNVVQSKQSAYSQSIEETFSQPAKDTTVSSISTHQRPLMRYKQTNSNIQSIRQLQDANPLQVIAPYSQIPINASQQKVANIDFEQAMKNEQSFPIINYKQREVPEMAVLEMPTEEVNKQQQFQQYQEVQDKQSISSNSVFGEESLARQAQRKKRMEELQTQIKRTKNIREQLQHTKPLGVKLFVSILAGSVVGGASYVLRRNKLGSLVVGVASGVSAFLLSK